MSDLISIIDAAEALRPAPPAGFHLNREFAETFYGLTPEELLYDGPEEGEVATQWSRACGIEVLCADTIMTIEKAERLHQELGCILEDLRAVTP